MKYLYGLNEGEKAFIQFNEHKTISKKQHREDIILKNKRKR